jgi:predicted nucleic acid-binding protein
VILVDSSAWVELIRATCSAVDKRLTRAIERDERLGTTGLVILELLAGARDERHASELLRLLARCDYLALQEPADHEAAAALYRARRQAGRTIRSLSDCLIATVAIRAGAELLHRDADFEAIALYAPLKTVACEQLR